MIALSASIILLGLLAGHYVAGVPFGSLVSWKAPGSSAQKPSSDGLSSSFVVNQAAPTQPISSPPPSTVPPPPPADPATKDCPEPRKIPGAIVDMVSRTQGSVVIYRCSSGYKPGQAMSVCQYGGRWTPAVLTCIPKTSSAFSTQRPQSHPGTLLEKPQTQAVPVPQPPQGKATSVPITTTANDTQQQKEPVTTNTGASLVPSLPGMSPPSTAGITSQGTTGSNPMLDMMKAFQGLGTSSGLPGTVPDMTQGMFPGMTSGMFPGMSSQSTQSSTKPAMFPGMDPAMNQMFNQMEAQLMAGMTPQMQAQLDRMEAQFKSSLPPHMQKMIYGNTGGIANPQTTTLVPTTPTPAPTTTTAVPTTPAPLPSPTRPSMVSNPFSAMAGFPGAMDPAMKAAMEQAEAKWRASLPPEIQKMIFGYVQGAQTTTLKPTPPVQTSKPAQVSKVTTSNPTRPVQQPVFQQQSTVADQFAAMFGLTGGSSVSQPKAQNQPAKSNNNQQNPDPMAILLGLTGPKISQHILHNPVSHTPQPWNQASNPATNPASKLATNTNVGKPAAAIFPFSQASNPVANTNAGKPMANIFPFDQGLTPGMHGMMSQQQGLQTAIQAMASGGNPSAGLYSLVGGTAGAAVDPEVLIERQEDMMQRAAQARAQLGQMLISHGLNGGASKQPNGFGLSGGIGGPHNPFGLNGGMGGQQNPFAALLGKNAANPKPLSAPVPEVLPNGPQKASQPVDIFKQVQLEQQRQLLLLQQQQKHQELVQQQQLQEQQRQRQSLPQQQQKKQPQPNNDYASVVLQQLQRQQQQQAHNPFGLLQQQQQSPHEMLQQLQQIEQLLNPTQGQSQNPYANMPPEMAAISMVAQSNPEAAQQMAMIRAFMNPA